MQNYHSKELYIKTSKIIKRVLYQIKRVVYQIKTVVYQIKRVFFFKLCLEQSILGLHCLPSTFWGCLFLLFATSLEVKCDLLVHLKEISKKQCHFASFYLLVQVNYQRPHVIAILKWMQL